jgi:hypothetical protein
MLEFFVLVIAGLAWALVRTDHAAQSARQRVADLERELRAERTWAQFRGNTVARP